MSKEPNLITEADTPEDKLNIAVLADSQLNIVTSASLVTQYVIIGSKGGSLAELLIERKLRLFRPKRGPSNVGIFDTDGALRVLIIGSPNEPEKHKSFELRSSDEELQASGYVETCWQIEGTKNIVCVCSSIFHTPDLSKPPSRSR